MRTTLGRFTAPLFAWIPDISAVPVRRQVTIGIIASVVLHLLAFLVMALLAGVVRKPVDSAQVRPPPEELEMRIIEPEEPKILPAPVAPEKQFIDSRGLAESKPAANPIFETDKDMTAASEKAAGGDVPLPSQDGRGKFDNVFDTKKSSVGPVKEPPAPLLEIASARSAQAQPPAKEMPAQEKPAPAQPTATPPPKPADKTDAAAVAKATLEKLREVEKKRDDEIALAAKQLPPLPQPVTKLEKPAPEPPIPRAIPVHPVPQQMAKLTAPAPPSKPGYQPEQEKSKVEGSITNRGKNAVDAVATPLGKYKAQVYNAIGSRWLYYVKSQMDMLAIGTAKVSFFVTRAGRVQDIHVDANTANASFAEVCERAIRDAEISQPPAGSLDQMRDGRLEYSITFTLYSFRE